VDPGLLALVASSGWASGVNLYLVVLLLGLAGRTGLADVPAALTRTDVLVVVGIVFALEFVVDKIPWLDSAWDLLHTGIRPLGAAALGLLLTGEAETWQQVVAALGSGGLATAAHVAKATTRAAVNTSPEPASNTMVSLGEDGLVTAVIALAVTNPVLALVVVLVLLVAGGVLTVVLFNAARRALARWRERRRSRRGPPAP
jgi:hypothetical protein